MSKVITVVVQKITLDRNAFFFFYIKKLKLMVSQIQLEDPMGSLGNHRLGGECIIEDVSLQSLLIFFKEMTREIALHDPQQHVQERQHTV